MNLKRECVRDQLKVSPDSGGVKCEYQRVSLASTNVQYLELLTSHV